MDFSGSLCNTPAETDNSCYDRATVLQLKDRLWGAIMGDNGNREQEFIPMNDLEKKLSRIGRGRTTPLKAFNFFLNSIVVVLLKSSGEEDDSRKKPLTLRGPGGEPLAAIFTSSERAAAAQKRHRTYIAAVPMPAWHFVSSLAPDRGIIVNPGWPIGFTVLPDDLNGFRRRFRLESK
jgi:hypothetical protein